MLVPLMILIYLLAVSYIVITNISDLPHYVALIFTDAFTAQAGAGGALGVMISNGIRRGAFSNEAGIGTEAMAHGAAKTREPVREGLGGMLEPAIDTLLVCSLAACALLIAGVWTASTLDGVTMTAVAFEPGIPGIGSSLLVLCVFFFSVTPMFSYAYCGTQWLNF